MTIFHDVEAEEEGRIRLRNTSGARFPSDYELNNLKEWCERRETSAANKAQSYFGADKIDVN